MSIRAFLISGILLAAAFAVPTAVRADDDDDEGSKPDAGKLTASAVGHDRATLSGDVEGTLWWIEYGPTADASARTQPAQVPATLRKGPVAVSATLTGLPAGTRIYARLVAHDDDDTDRGKLMSFTTAAAPATTPTPTPTPAPPEAPAPGTPAPPAGAQLGETVGVQPERGTVRVRVPGSDGFLPLAAGAALPVGTVVDAREGAIALTAALPDGSVQHATFGGGRFQVRQAQGGRTDLHLRGGSFAGCRRARAARTLAAVAARKRPKPVRRLWGKDRSGRFRTHGRDSVTTVRGTEWSVADRCHGTLTRVTEGAVDVKVRRTGRVVRVEAGERFLARHRR